MSIFPSEEDFLLRPLHEGESMPIDHKDQQIKDLTKLLQVAEKCIDGIIECDSDPISWQSYPILLEKYKQKYPNQL